MNCIRLSRIAELTGNKPDTSRLDIKITSLCYDSRKAVSGGAFFCLIGALSDGHDYALDAYLRGCRVFVCEKVPRGFPKRGTKLIMAKQGTRAALADVAAEFYGHPEKALKLIGITGTKGKTTTAEIIYSILNQNGIKAGYIGTNGVKFGEYRFKTVNTTPECCDLYEYLSMMVKDGVSVAAIEVSSQALMVGRTRGITFDTAVFTNLYRDHIGGVEHPTFENYKECKKLLFSEHCGRAAIINTDADAADEFLAATPKCIHKITCSIGGESDYRASALTKCEFDGGLGISFTCLAGDEGFRVNLGIPGEYNTMNALEAIAVCRFYGVSMSKIVESLETVFIEGRFEMVQVNGVDYVIDYAHNGESLRSVLEVLRSYEPRRLICLYGSVGGRTQMRRAELGSVASKLADFSILTSDNPDFEDPKQIIADIAKEYKNEEDYIAISDRREAIEYAVSIAKPGDIVLLAGKGHEKYQLIAGERVLFCEKEILIELREAEKEPV